MAKAGAEGARRSALFPESVSSMGRLVTGPQHYRLRFFRCCAAVRRIADIETPDRTGPIHEHAHSPVDRRRSLPPPAGQLQQLAELLRRQRCVRYLNAIASCIIEHERSPSMMFVDLQEACHSAVLLGTASSILCRINRVLCA